VNSPQHAASGLGAHPLIIHADDFGETEQITLGICAGIEAGVITSTSIMANMPATDFALGRARSLAERASFGVHLTLCEGRPLTRAPTLVDSSGNFCGKRRLFLRSISGQLKQEDVEAEVGAQLERIADGGVRVSHLDGHKHLHQLPVVCAAVASVAHRHGVERVRLAAMHAVAGYSSPSSAVRELLALHAGRVFRNAKLRFPQRLIDIRACMALASQPDKWLRLVRSAGIVEIFCHPGTELADEEKPGSCDRSEELDFLLSPRMQQLLGAGGSSLVNYWSV
jgi:chitin disaccharide deacetylase